MLYIYSCLEFFRLQRPEIVKHACDGFHFPAFIGKVIVKAVADPFSLWIGKQLRKMLGAHKSPEERNDQRFLNRVFSMWYFIMNSSSQRHVHRHHQAEANGKEDDTYVGVFSGRHFRYQLLHDHVQHGSGRER